MIWRDPGFIVVAQLAESQHWCDPGLLVARLDSFWWFSRFCLQSLRVVAIYSSAIPVSATVKFANVEQFGQQIPHLCWGSVVV